METAVRLADEVDNYTLDAVRSDNPEEYAVTALRERYGQELGKFGNLYELGQQLMKLDGVNATAYGELRRRHCAVQSQTIFRTAEVCGAPALFAKRRIECSDVPEGLHMYEMREGIAGSHTIERSVPLEQAVCGNGYHSRASRLRRR